MDRAVENRQLPPALRYADHVGIHYVLCNKLRQFPYEDIEFFLPQLCHLIISVDNESMALEEFLLDLCEESVTAALLTFWLFQTYLHDLSSNPQAEAFKTCRRVSNKVQHIVFGLADAGRNEKIKENILPVMVLGSFVLAGIGVPGLAHWAGPLAVAQGRKPQPAVDLVPENVSQPQNKMARSHTINTTTTRSKRSKDSGRVTSAPDPSVPAVAVSPDLPKSPRVPKSRPSSSGGSRTPADPDGGDGNKRPSQLEMLSAGGRLSSSSLPLPELRSPRMQVSRPATPVSAGLRPSEQSVNLSRRHSHHVKKALSSQAEMSSLQKVRLLRQNYFRMTDRRRRRRERHVWSTFELNAAIALICKGSHKVRPSSSSGFAVELNKALNSRRANFHEGDIDERDIEDLLRFLLTENKAAVAFAERTMPACITRSKRMAFSRRIDFTGSMTEWDHGGRKDAVMDRGPGQRRRTVLPSLATRRGSGLDDGSSSGGGEYERSDGLETGELRERGPQKPMVFNLPPIREAIGDVYDMADPRNAHHRWRAQGSDIVLPSIRDQPWAGFGGIDGHQPALQAHDMNSMTGTHREWTTIAAAAGAQSARDGLGGGTQQGVTNEAIPAGAGAGATSLSPYMSSVNSDGRINTGYSTAPTGFPFQDVGVGIGGDMTGRGGMGNTNNNNYNGQQATWGNVMLLPVGQGGDYDENHRPGPTGPPPTYDAQGPSVDGAMGNMMVGGGGGWQGDATGTGGVLFDRAPPPTLGSAVMTGTNNNSNGMTASHGHGSYSGNEQGFWSSGGGGGTYCQPGGFYDANGAARAADASDLVVPGSSSNVDPAHLMLGPTTAAFPSSASSSAEWGCGGAQYGSGYRHLGVTNIEAQQQQQYNADGRYGSSGTTTVSAGGGKSGRLYPVVAAAAAGNGPTSGDSGINVVEVSSSTGIMAQRQGWEPVTGGGGDGGYTAEEVAVPASYGVPPQQYQ
ncbi:phosphatidylinositol 4-kinase PIK1alpha [Magnaporthiopsis poae ATCC 64411]|uniref:Phosphatidylinositol 4-kinase PIK1alpha n=1 Tax=Magnaporthiopsis poae (strain ATCC 64411 / 73-15) TaxID=644358 RepID=A0A0C4DTL1_MAGP6|nr:phosphatidylinositol 4-kinase PIK1alpha [Magnaporthiopsis poae ATCC 64411]